MLLVASLSPVQHPWIHLPWNHPTIGLQVDAQMSEPSARVATGGRPVILFSPLLPELALHLY